MIFLNIFVVRYLLMQDMNCQRHQIVFVLHNFFMDLPVIQARILGVFFQIPSRVKENTRATKDI